MNFESVIAPIELPAFIETLIKGIPLHIPGHPGKFGSLFSKTAFWKCVAEGKPEGAPFPRVSLTAYQLPLAFERGAISRALRSGNTVCTSQIDRVSQELRQLCLATEMAVGFPGTATVHCYYSPPGTGYSFFHLDSGVAVTLQLEGRKTWKYSPKPAIPWSIRVGGYRERGQLEWFGDSDWQPPSDSLPTPDELGYTEVVLSPGDVLVMPPGVWHSVSASDSTSISLNLKLTAAPSIEGILQLVRQACLKEERWRRPFPFATPDELQTGIASESTKQEVKDLILALGKVVSNLAADDAELSRMWFRNFLGSQDSVQGQSGTSITSEDVLCIPTGIHPRLSVENDGTTTLLGQGKILQIHGRSINVLLRDILERRCFRVSELYTWNSAGAYGSPQLLQILQRLFDCGFLQICEGERCA